MRLLVWLFVLSIWAAPAASADVWRRYETPNFIVYSDNPVEQTRRYINDLEAYRHGLRSLSRLSDESESALPLTLYYFHNDADFRQTWPGLRRGVLGHLSGCAEGRAAFAHDPGNRLGSNESHGDAAQDEHPGRTIIFHEYTHHFMLSAYTVRYPPWFTEGFAEYYSTARFEEDQVLVGQVWSLRLEGLEGRDQISYVDLISENSAARLHNTDSFYARSWLLTHFILSDPERSARFAEWLEDYNAGTDPVTAFEARFAGKLADLDDRLKVYLDKEMTAQVYRLPAMPPVHINETDMPGSASKLMPLDAAIRVCNGNDDMLRRVRREAARYPADDYARMVAARAEIILGDEEVAIAPVMAHLADQPDDADAWKWLGVAWYLTTAHDKTLPGETPASQMGKARDALMNAYRRQPLDATNLYYLSLSRSDLPGYPDATAVNAALEAQRLSPSTQVFNLRAAWVLISTDRLDEAKAPLALLAADPHSGRTARWARTIIAAIDRGEPKDVVLALIESDPRDTER